MLQPESNSVLSQDLVGVDGLKLTSVHIVAVLNKLYFRTFVVHVEFFYLFLHSVSWNWLNQSVVDIRAISYTKWCYR